MSQMIVGFECVTYRNTGSFGSPVWNECESIRDSTLALSKDKIDGTVRGANATTLKLKRYRSGMTEGMISISMPWDDADADFLAFLTAFLAGTVIEVLALSGPIATTGTRGLRCEHEVFKCERGEKIGDLVMAEIELCPSAKSINAASWVVN